MYDLLGRYLLDGRIEAYRGCIFHFLGNPFHYDLGKELPT